MMKPVMDWLKYNKRSAALGGIALLALSAAFLYAGLSPRREQAAQPPVVRTLAVRAEGAGPAAVYSGEVRGRFESALSFQVGGQLLRRRVDQGSVVRAGDVLMEIDPRDVRQTVNITSAQQTAAQSQLALAETNLKRYRTLYEQGAVSRAVFDQYENAYSAALAAANQASAQYAQSANALGYTALAAPADGVVAAVAAEAGQVVAAGQPVLTFVQEGEREVEVEVPENRYEQIRTARQIEVTFWALPGRRAEGTVREISPVADKVARTYKVRIRLVNPPPELKLGMTASVSVASPGAAASLFIPLSAVYQTDGNPAVWVVRDGTVSLRPVRLGMFGDGTVQVLEGLRDGELIVTAGVHKLREGLGVRLEGEAK